MKKILLAILSVVFFIQAQAAERGDLLIRNATVITVTNGDHEDTDVLIEDGIITRIGRDLSAPNGVEAIDASGKYVMPGIIDPHSHLAISRGINEATNPVTPEVTMYDVIDPNHIGIYRALAGGVTTAQIMHGSANVIGGRSATVKFRYGASAEEMHMDGAPQLVKFALGENPTRVYGIRRNMEPRTRMGVEQVVRKAFDSALGYRKERNAYLEQKAGHERNPRRTDMPETVAKDLRLEVIADILEGKVLVHSHSYRADEILMLMRVFKDYGIEDLTFQHIIEGFKVAPEISENGYYASSFMDWWSFKFEAYYATAYNSAIMVKNGVLASIHSDSPEIIRHLNHEAAKAVKYGGITRGQALELITISPAVQMGIDDRVGSIEEGKDGDVVIWSHHPLSIYAIAERTFIDGVERFNRDEDPDDMRLSVDPEQSYEGVSQNGPGSYGHDECMRDVFHLFE
ncbi:MAG: amidohydrolase family protein [Balneolales bacterium]